MLLDQLQEHGDRYAPPSPFFLGQGIPNSRHGRTGLIGTTCAAGGFSSVERDLGLAIAELQNLVVRRSHKQSQPAI